MMMSGNFGLPLNDGGEEQQQHQMNKQKNLLWKPSSENTELYLT